jgi:hypothetical protein
MINNNNNTEPKLYLDKLLIYISSIYLSVITIKMVFLKILQIKILY